MKIRVFAGVFALIACSGGYVTPAGQAGLVVASGTATPACPAATANDPWTVASGSVQGGAVGVEVVNAGVALATKTGWRTLLEFEGGCLHFATPAGATSAAGMNVVLEIPSVTPGTFDSAQSCGSVVVDYALPAPSGVDCGGVTPTSAPASCPQGCVSECGDRGCAPCRAIQTGARHYAYNPCPEDLSGNAVGSWTVTLTSVVPYTGPITSQGEVDYLAHGTITASLFGGNGEAGTGNLSDGAQPASLTLSF